MNKTQFKISIGALVGSVMIGGATYGILNKISGRTLIPFHQETIKEYAINKKILSINYNTNEENKFEETTEKEYILEEQLKNINTIELMVSSPYFSDESGRIYINHYKYLFQKPLTIKEIEEKIELLESRNFAELIKDCDWSKTYQESPIILPETNTMKAEMIIYSVDYNDLKLHEQSLDDDFNESMILVYSTLIGGGLGAIVQETINIQNEIINMEPKIKKKIKKKELENNTK